MLTYLFDVSIDGLVFQPTSFTTTWGRRVQDSIPARGDGNEALDQGTVPKKFGIAVDFLGTGDEVAARQQEFYALAAIPGNRVFSHPVLGRFVVKLGSQNFSDSAGSHTMSMELVVVEPFTTTAVSTEVVSQEETDFEISFLAEALGQDPPDLGEFEAVFVGDPPDLGEFPPMDLQNMSDRTNSWDSSTTSPAQMNRDIEQMITEKDAVQATLGKIPMTSDIIAALIQLDITIGTVIRRARTVAAADELRWSEIELTRDVTLRRFIVDLYGQDADEFYDLIRIRSGIRNPWSVPTGTLLQVPSR